MANQHKRPLSPHLQIYKPQLTMVTSILNRITGLLLCAFSVGWILWLLALNNGPEALATFQQCLQSIPGKILSVLAIWSLFYHLCNGVRHLLWDTGSLLELQASRRAGWLVVFASLFLTGIAIGSTL